MANFRHMSGFGLLFLSPFKMTGSNVTPILL